MSFCASLFWSFLFPTIFHRKGFPPLGLFVAAIAAIRGAVVRFFRKLCRVGRYSRFAIGILGLGVLISSLLSTFFFRDPFVFSKPSGKLCAIHSLRFSPRSESITHMSNLLTGLKFGINAPFGMPIFRAKPSCSLDNSSRSTRCDTLPCGIMFTMLS